MDRLDLSISSNASDGKTKKKVSWAPDDSLTEIQYFEVDDTERTNNPGNFLEAIQQEKLKERSVLARTKIFANDRMLAAIPWKHPLITETIQVLSDKGSKSEEKETQAEREKSVLAILFLTKDCVPDFPAEPDSDDIVPFKEAKIIPHFEPGTDPPKVSLPCKHYTIFKYTLRYILQ